MKKDMICILCPMGCALTVTEENGEVSVRGNTCPRGAAYGKQELINPQRVVTSSVPVAGAREPVCPVKTKGQVPKSAIPAVLRAIKAERLTAPVRIGDIVIANAAGTGVSVVATANRG